jgi:lysophospholipid hydrolase
VHTGSWQQPNSIINTPSNAKYEAKPSHVNFSTVAVLAVTEDVPLSAFSYELIHSLSSIGNKIKIQKKKHLYPLSVFGSYLLLL